MSHFHQVHRDASDLITSLLEMKSVLATKGLHKTPKIDELVKKMEWTRSPERSREELKPDLGQAFRELAEAAQLSEMTPFILHPGLAGALPKTWKTILKDDSDLANAAHQDKTFRRNRQYELWLCSMFLARRIPAIWINREGEPDVRIGLERSGHVFHLPLYFHIEAKRPGKFSSIAKNVDEAAVQYSGRNLRDCLGLISVSLELPLLDLHMRVSQETGELAYHFMIGGKRDLERPFRDAIDRVRQESAADIRSTLNRHPGVAGVIFSGTFTAAERRIGNEPLMSVLSLIEMPQWAASNSLVQAEAMRQLQECYSHNRCRIALDSPLAFT